MSANISVNGEARPLSAATVIELLRQVSIDPAAEGVAVALNGAVLPRRDWAATALSAGDRIEIVKPFRGG
ncbi:MAG: sulfur carrier protein ThiS [Kiloniellales bacterium]